MHLADPVGWSTFFPVGGGAGVMNRAFPPVLKAVLRGQPDHFQVAEVLMPETGGVTAGRAEHLWVQIKKRSTNTSWVAQQLAVALGVKKRAVGFSGHKDRHAETVQWFSVWLPGRCAGAGGAVPDLSAFSRQTEVTVLQALWQPRKIQRGTHRFNDFRVQLTELEGNTEAIAARLAKIAVGGVPNLFGPQRFGQQDLTGAAPVRWSEDREKRGWQISALRSALFNHLVAQRVAEGTWHYPLDSGDWLQWRGSRAGFSPERLDERLQGALESGELSPTGWLSGTGSRPGEAPLPCEQAQLEPWRGWIEALVERRVRGQRRPSRLQPDQLQWTLGERSLTLTFRLPAGAFATALIAALGTWSEPVFLDNYRTDTCSTRKTA